MVVHCCTLSICYLGAEIDHYRNPNQYRDHLVGQLTRLMAAVIGFKCWWQMLRRWKGPGTLQHGPDLPHKQGWGFFIVSRIISGALRRAAEISIPNQTKPNNGQQWITTDNNPRCYMHLWCRFYHQHHNNPPHCHCISMSSGLQKDDWRNSPQWAITDN